MTIFGDILKNPIWRAKNSITYVAEAQAPTLWDFDNYGLASPSNNRSLTPEEQAWMGAYNADRSRMNAAGQRAVDNAIQSVLPSTWGISPTVNTATTGALTWVQPVYSCPLILDLDGGGISNSGIAPGLPIFFDHDGDGVRSATGWVGAGEAIVVRDLNGNGTIDSGREIFGDNTLLTRGPKAGQRAANGFEALADLDSNNDGQFNAADTAFASVKLWKDANQNGISEVGELFTFAQLGVQGIKVSGWVDGTRLTDADGELTGNRQILAGTFTWANGGGGQACTTCACIQ